MGWGYGGDRCICMTSYTCKLCAAQNSKKSAATLSIQAVNAYNPAGPGITQEHTCVCNFFNSILSTMQEK